MDESTIQYVSDENGNAVSVIVPIELWREIESERETAYLLLSAKMRERLLQAMGCQDDAIPAVITTEQLRYRSIPFA